jgi:hypothetical protein
MLVQLEREGKIEIVNNVIIHIGDSKYRITETNESELMVCKVGFNDYRIKITPCSTNEILIK